LGLIKISQLKKDLTSSRVDDQINKGGPSKIKKPAGERGRSGRGGYNLEAEMIINFDWSKERYKKLRVR
jgi:hypothetical protein